jgi:hypothetical protein
MSKTLKPKFKEESKMKNFVKNLTNLIKVKTIVTLVVLFVFAVLALKGDIAPDNVMVIVSTVVAFYFGTQHEKKIEANTDKGGENDV